MNRTTVRPLLNALNALIGLIALTPLHALTAQTVTIHAARLLDGKGGSMLNPLVTVSGGRIIRVARAAPGARADYDL
ncbi:MAG TPA: hypothetical protein VFU23_04465, partial [Gemmatimonadales bacterium]|nr:hypothetical protein [Gemmatimonadales bacterium]